MLSDEERTKILSEHSAGSLYNLSIAIERAVLAKASEKVPEFNGWYCAQCQCGVDPSEVTYHETHTVCGRYITDDEPPKAMPAPKQEPDWYVVDRTDCDPKIFKKEEDALHFALASKSLIVAKETKVHPVFIAPPQAAAIPTERQILSVAKMVMPAAYLAEENYKICSFAYAILSSAPKPEGE